MRTRATPPRSDVALAVLALVLVALEVSLNDAIEPKSAAAVTGLAAAALAWRRVFPLAVAAAAAFCVAVVALAGVPLEQPVMPLLVILVASYSLSVHVRLERALAGLVAMTAGGAVAVVSQSKGVGELAFGMIFVAGAWAIGQVVRARTTQVGVLERRADELERESEERERAAAAEERGRIARELHDLVAHSVSVMVVQAGAAEEMLDRDPARAREALRAVQETGRRAHAETGRMLGVLRDHADELGLAPQPRLDEVDALVDEARAAGLPVELEVEGERRALPAAVELSAYRIVQEALTNVRKHAGRAHVDVAIRYRDDSLEVEVVDDGDGTRAAAAGAGHGLVGMRERVAVFGGSLEAGPREPAGFRVRARLPVEGGA